MSVLELRKFWDLPKEVGEAWQMQSGDITGSEKLVKTKLREVHWYQEFGGLKYWVD